MFFVLEQALQSPCVDCCEHTVINMAEQGWIPATLIAFPLDTSMQSWSVGSHTSSIFNILESCRTVFHTGCTSWYPTNGVWGWSLYHCGRVCLEEGLLPWLLNGVYGNYWWSDKILFCSCEPCVNIRKAAFTCIQSFKYIIVVWRENVCFSTHCHYRMTSKGAQRMRLFKLFQLFIVPGFCML